MFIKKYLLFIVSVIVSRAVDDNGNGVSTKIEDNPFSVGDNSNFTIVDDRNFTMVDDNSDYFTMVDDNGDYFTMVDGNGDYFTNGGYVNVAMNKMMILSLLTLFM